MQDSTFNHEFIQPTVKCGKINHMQVLVYLVFSVTLLLLLAISRWAFAVSGDTDINELGNSYDADTGVQNDTEIFWDYFSSK